MKVGKTDRTNRTGRVKSGYKADGHKGAALSVEAPGATASVLGIPEFQTLWPIPQAERTAAPGLTQNPGY